MIYSELGSINGKFEHGEVFAVFGHECQAVFEGDGGNERVSASERVMPRRAQSKRRRPARRAMSCDVSYHAREDRN